MSGTLFQRVEADTFREALAVARTESEIVRAATSAPEELPATADYYLSTDTLSGFGVTHDGELIGVHSRVKGRGDTIVETACNVGATRLDCFDGYLPTLYSRHGFTEVDRVPNWTPGEPDVVFMARV